MQQYYVSLLGHVSKRVSILLSKLGDCPNSDTSMCYCNYPFLTVKPHRLPHHRKVASRAVLATAITPCVHVASFKTSIRMSRCQKNASET